MATTVKPATKGEILTKIAEATELSRKQVASVFDALSEQTQLLSVQEGAWRFRGTRTP